MALKLRAQDAGTRLLEPFPQRDRQLSMFTHAIQPVRSHAPAPNP
jgi:hypothetical protein